MTTALNLLHNEKDPEFQAWLHVLKQSPTKAWEQPILAFIDSIKEKLPNGKIGLSGNNTKRRNCFTYNIVRSIYAKSLANEPKDGQTIKQEMLNATALAKQGKIYEPKIKITKNFRLSKQFEQKLNGNIPKQLQWGLCAVVEFTHNLDDFIERTKRKQHILETATVEQILPNKWDTDFPNKLNKWTTERIEKSLQTIGNLILIEQDIHKTTNKIYKNNFFATRKKQNNGKSYRDSVFNELVMLCKVDEDIEWFYGLWKSRQKYCVERLIEFFSGLYNPTLP
jgi:hypothetical protein